jgi:hypothetical protein
MKIFDRAVHPSEVATPIKFSFAAALGGLTITGTPAVPSNYGMLALIARHASHLAGSPVIVDGGDGRHSVLDGRRRRRSTIN